MTVPPWMRGSRPCLMLFSISGCRRMLGTRTLEGLGIDVLFDAQLVGAKADHLDVEVIVGEAELVAEGDVGVVILEQRAQDVGQFHGHLARQFGPAADQRSDGVEGVEEEVRIDLALEGVEAGFEQEMFLFLELDFEAEGVPHLEGDADDHGSAEPDQDLKPRAAWQPGQRACGNMRACSQADEVHAIGQFVRFVKIVYAPHQAAFDVAPGAKVFDVQITHR